MWYIYILLPPRRLSVQKTFFYLWIDAVCSRKQQQLGANVGTEVAELTRRTTVSIRLVGWCCEVIASVPLLFLAHPKYWRQLWKCRLNALSAENAKHNFGRTAHQLRKRDHPRSRWMQRMSTTRVRSLVGLSAGLQKNYWADFHQTRREDESYLIGIHM